MSVSFDQIAGDQELIELIFELSGIEFLSDETQPAIYRVEGVADLIVIAGDGAGGQFVTSRSSGRVYYFSAEGEAGVLGKDFASFMATVVAIPCWLEVLKFSGGGKLDEMRRAATAFNADWAASWDAIELREALRERLRLARPADAVADLHDAVATSSRIDDPWGVGTVTLFGPLTIDDIHPMVRPGGRYEGTLSP
jgi:hypothetical protein